MGTSIVVTSGKGGVGKTTTSANLSLALVDAGQKVCVVDLDIGLRNLDTILGLSNRVIYEIIDVTNDNVPLRQALVKDPRHPNLSLLAASQNANQDNLNIKKMTEIVDSLKKDFDFVILDCPAGIENGFRTAVSVADSALVITNPEIASVSDADRVVGLLEEAHLRYGIHLVINRVRLAMLQNGSSMDIQGIVDKLSVPLIGVIIDSDEVISTSNSGDSVVANKKDNLAAIGYINLAKRILGEKIPLNEIDMGNSSEKHHNFIYKLFHKDNKN